VAVDDDTWVALSEEPLPLDVAASWATRPDCGAVVSFFGTVRDHSEGRPGVFLLEYEAYTEHVARLLAEVAARARRSWPAVARVALLHRVGSLEVADVSVVVVVSAPHRAEAFDAARFCIDTVKETVPIWKKEHWSDGAAWSTCSSELHDSTSR